MSALELYRDRIKAMSPSERLRLASLILNDLAREDHAVDEGDAWSEEDLRDVARATSAHINRELGDDDAGAR